MESKDIKKGQNKKPKYTKRKSSFLHISYFRLQGGFTLLEVLVATFIITVGIMGSLSLVSRTIYSANISSKRLITTYLAQEGIEIVRNIRDTNWLEGKIAPPGWNWNEQLTSCSIGCIVDYTYSTQLDPNLLAYTGQFLKIDANGFYNYSSGTPTKFKRKIIITPNGPDILKVSVWVDWQGKVEVTAQENLYNWQ